MERIGGRTTLSRALILQVSVCAALGLIACDGGSGPGVGPYGYPQGGNGSGSAGASPSLSFAPSNVPAPSAFPTSPMKLVGACTIDTDQLNVRCNTREAEAPAEAQAFLLTRQTGPDALDVVTLTVRSMRIEADAVVNVTGSYPLAVISGGDVQIDGTLRARPKPDGTAQAGGFGAARGPGATTRYPDAQAWGGAGHCGRGGRGSSSTAGVDNRGASYGAPEIVPLIGGSSGGYNGGAGGGAIQIASGSRIEVSAAAVIDVGASGAGGSTDGGGGSGGSILLEAPVVRVAGTLAANGGGGASNGPVTADVPPSTDSTPDAVPAPGSRGGGHGAAANHVDGSDGAAAVAANPGWYLAGGGGGAGRIRVNTASGSADLTGTVSPSVGTPCMTFGKIQ